jgi:hypothetical protein
MIRKILIAGSALAAVAAFTLVSAPVEAGSCAYPSAKARGLDQKAVGARSAKHLKHKINHWAHKNKLKAVHVGTVSTVCKKGGVLAVCTSSAKVCP